MADSPVGTLIAAVGTLATVGATVIGVMTYMDGKKEKEAQLSEPTASYAESSLPETTQPRAELSAADTAAQKQADTTASQSKTTAPQTSAPETEQTAANTGTAPALDNTVRADSDFSVRTLAEAHPAHYRYMPSTFFSYDANKGVLYFVRDTEHIASCDIASGAVQELYDLSGKAEVLGLTVDPQSGKLFAAVQYQQNRSYVQLYDCTADQTVCDNIAWQQQDYDSNAMLVDKSYIHIFTNRNSYGIYKAGDGRIGWGDTELYQKLRSHAYAAVVPFLHDGSYWHLFLDCDYDRKRYTLDVTKTTRILPSASCELSRIGEYKGICGISAGADGLCYIDPERNIRECDPDGPRSEGTLLSGGENPDTLLVDGSRIQDTATDYLSKNVPLFLRIDNSHFVMYDADDSALKLLYAAD